MKTIGTYSSDNLFCIIVADFYIVSKNYLFAYCDTFSFLIMMFKVMQNKFYKQHINEDSTAFHSVC